MRTPQDVFCNRYHKHSSDTGFLIGGMYDEDLTSVIASLHDDRHWDNNGKSVENDFLCDDDGVHVRGEFPVYIRQEVMIGDYQFFQFYVSDRDGYWWTEAKNVRIA